MMRRFIFSFPSISTFCLLPYYEEIKKIEKDTKVAIIGIPWDEGAGFIPGQRLAPKQIRDYSARFRLPKNGFFLIENEKRVLENLKMIDLGDIGTYKTLPQKTFDNITESIEEIVAKNIFPIILGGDHSITYPVVRGFNKYKNLGIIQIDAHLDFTFSREDITLGNENCIRRVSELPFVSSIIQLGIRGLLPIEEPFLAAKKRGNIIITTEKIKKEGPINVVKNLYKKMNTKNFYLTLDIDALDPSIAPGTATREPNGLTYEEVKQILQNVAKLYNIVGLDVVEVNPLIDPSGLTAIVAVRLILDFLFSYFARNKNLN